MDIRSQIAMVFHLDKCIGCHTCSVACKNIWTDRKGAEYMWWNNVETKPGTGYPGKWEDQEIYHGGWKLYKEKGNLQTKLKAKGLGNIFHNPYMPSMADYYEPFTYKYKDLFTAKDQDDQPTAIPVSQITGEFINIKGGPNWDDDLSGTPDYARQDVNLGTLSPLEQEAMFHLERMTFHYLPRICNHCLNPACVAACPSGAIYKRGEDGVVLVNQEKCRGWRMCVSACPYKKTYYNWNSGKSEKCILCFPRLESGQAPACMHTCVGRIRYLGVMLYDADKIKEIASAPDEELVQAQRNIYVDPFDEEVVKEALRNGVHRSTIECAQKSPVWKFVKEWEIALPLHPEFRTLPNLFYVPPLLPAMASFNDGKYDNLNETFWSGIDNMRVPLKYLANMFSAGQTETIREVIGKLMAVRHIRRNLTVNDQDEKSTAMILKKAGLTIEKANAIYRLTSLPKFDERFVIPEAHREEAIEMIEGTEAFKGNTGFGKNEKPERGL